MIKNEVLHWRAFRIVAAVLRSTCVSRVPTLRMPARETEAIILKTFPLGEADRLVSFLGRSSGRMRGVAAGARRIKNRYGSTLQILSHVQIWYVERETRDLVRIQQADLLESFNKAQSDYALSTSLALVSEVAELVLPEHEVNEAMFRLILLSAREIERLGNSALAVSYFAFWTVRLAGWLPRFDVCAICGRPFGKGNAYQTAYQPGLLDEGHRRPGMKPVSLEARELAEVFAKQRLDQLDPALGTLPGAKELREAGLNWIEHHTERKLATRELLEVV
jgi:DNA repair protein RecO (recombination protein O)